MAIKLRLPITIDYEAISRARIFGARLDSFRDKYRGERCFVVGTGPSLAKVPMDKLIGEYSFGMNRISLIYDRTDWRPSFYTTATVAAQDPNWAASSRETIALGIPSFIYWELLAYICDGGPAGELPDNVYPIECTQGKTGTYDTPPDEWWSWDIGERVSKHGTSMLPALQIAVFMGFNPIYIIGADAHWEPFDYEKDIDPNHFDSSYWEKMHFCNTDITITAKTAHRYSHQCRTAHELAYRVTSRRGINIYNATAGGRLEVYPRVNLRDVIKWK